MLANYILHKMLQTNMRFVTCIVTSCFIVNLLQTLVNYIIGFHLRSVSKNKNYFKNKFISRVIARIFLKQKETNRKHRVIYESIQIIEDNLIINQSDLRHPGRHKSKLSHPICGLYTGYKC